ncbi:MAG: nucleotidyl transferase AbiEii/AbiGii toxin family protein [candidate division WWE3 bacterium]|nr:nucleotidyl transferase AbiEii/AbiGii toxin family protein [candidate division WWE3 bacterium]
MKFFESAPPLKTKTALDKIKSKPEFTDFYLSGGTALSLQLGHRESEDLDFFTSKEFNPEMLQTKLLPLGDISDATLEKNTLNLFLDGVKIQFLYYPYRMLENLVPYENINLSSVIDVACTKLITISARGSKKDFIDLYFLLQTYTLVKLFENLDKKYQGVNYNHIHIVKSLTYFDDADAQPMPRMHQEADWEEIKKVIIKKVVGYKI